MPLFTRNIPTTDATTEEPSSETAAEPVTEAADTAVEEPAAEEPPVQEAAAEGTPAEEASAAEPSKPTRAAEAAKPTGAAEASDTTEATEASKPDEPSRPAKAAKPAQVDEASRPAEAAEPTEAAEASKSTEPDQPGKSAEPQESTDLTAPGDAAKPDWRTRRPTAARNLRWAVTALSVLLVIGALQMPNTLGNLRISEFFRLPAEAIVGAVVLLAMPRRPRVIAAAGIGAFLGALTVLNLLDMGFVEYLGRHFNLVLDWQLLADAQSYLTDTIGTAGSIAATLAVIALALLLPVVTALATVRLSGLLARNNTVATKATLIAGTVWITSMSLGLTIGGVPIASDHTAGVVKVHARRASDTFRDEAAFEKFAKKDPFANTPGDQLVPDLRGKDVIVMFIESYGRSAIEDPVMAPGVGKTLADGTRTLTDAGFAAKSGWLTSATYGGSSWLGHSTFLSGLWINNQQRYNTLVNSDRLTLTEAFRRTGDWRTVGVMPGVQKRWPEEEFYGLEKNYESRDLGYKGPKFSWSTMPDQYTLEAFQRLEHGRKSDKPLMSEIILTSSHQPWAPLPETVPQDQLGDGSVFEDIQKAGKDPKDVLYDETQAKQEYGKSIQYSVTSVVDWLKRYGTDDTVLVFLGDHQPMSQVSGPNASRDVPISIVAKDPKVLDKITDWNWSDGLRPTDEAPVWKMSAFRDKFLTAYGSTVPRN
ncbi:sulfatase-like hydrolase/transferase [Streptomyces sp. NPDC020898]|uniref:sulfatase-like hydrolase/transferase n=1 Tax=Streptomyces sp. NPDC020898 TaxID=3365101 RepID=UPI0037B39570